MGWVSAGDAYEVSLRDGVVVARSIGPRASGQPLKSLPKALRDHPEVDRLRRLAEWLDRHAAACVARVDAWMVSSLPIPTAVLARVWPDPAWRDALRDLVVVGPDPDQPGLLRDVTDAGEPRVVDLDGETVRFPPGTVTAPHPVLLPHLDELREFAAELGVTQRVEQLQRRVWRKPTTVDDGTNAPDSLDIEARNADDVASYAVVARARSLGYRVTGETATCRVWEGGHAVTPTFVIRPSGRSVGRLSWQVARGRTLRLTEVGPVAWSEGIRMAQTLSGNQSVGATAIGEDQQG